MKTATISQTKNQLSALLDEVQHGETILVVDRGRPVARIEPVRGNLEEGDGKLLRLERAGLLRRGKGTRLQELLDERPPKAKRDADILAVLLSEREDSR